MSLVLLSMVAIVVYNSRHSVLTICLHIVTRSPSPSIHIEDSLSYSESFLWAISTPEHASPHPV